MSTKTITTVQHIVQGSIALGIEWEPWRDVSPHGCSDVYIAISKAELFHHFMLHGTYPEPFASHPNARLELPEMQAVRNLLLTLRGETKFKYRTRVVRRTTVSTITDEEIDKAMIVKHGEQT